MRRTRVMMVFRQKQQARLILDFAWLAAWRSVVPIEPRRAMRIDSHIRRAKARCST